MSTLRSQCARAVLLLGGMIQTTVASGCGGNSNEKEFLSSAPPGVQTGDPNESYSQRRERTKNAAKKSDAAADRKAAGEKKH